MAEVTEIHAWVGGQVDADSHGDVTFGVRRGAWRADLYTDTVELAWEPRSPHGKAWVALRANGMSAELFISPWANGAPDPARAMMAAYAGADLGAYRYGPAGTYFGGAGWVRAYFFDTYGGGARAFVGNGDATLGIWRSEFSAALRAGAHIEAAGGAPALQPHLQAELAWHPDTLVAPVANAWAALAQGETAVTRTRIGGLTPYGVPMPGAAWAEWWVEDYAAARIGLAAGSTGMNEPASVVRGRGSLTGELAWMSAPYGDVDAPRLAVGFSAGGTLTWRRTYLSTDVGYAPWIPRAPGVSRVSVFFRLGLDWSEVSPAR